MIDLRSPWSAYVELCKAHGVCAGDGSGGDFNEQILKEQPDATMEKVLEPFKGHCAGVIQENWILWTIATFGKEMAADLRALYISQVSDPVIAMRFIAECKDLTATELTTLEAIYKGKMTSDKARVVVKYVSAENYGKGFISPTDATNLKFEGISDTLWKVEGVEATVDTWIAKVSGTLIEKAIATSVRVG